MGVGDGMLDEDLCFTPATNTTFGPACVSIECGPRAFTLRSTAHDW